MRYRGGGRGSVESGLGAIVLWASAGEAGLVDELSRVVIPAEGSGRTPPRKLYGRTGTTE